MPIIIEIVDREEKIRLLLPHLDTMVREGMVTMEYVVVLAYREGQDANV
jgi:PII-like signaling protein